MGIKCTAWGNEEIPHRNRNLLLKIRISEGSIFGITFSKNSYKLNFPIDFHEGLSKILI